jgi:hypothetical protein
LEAGNKHLKAQERYVAKQSGLVKRQIELERETRRVADKAIGYRNWQQNSGGYGGRQNLGEKEVDLGHGQLVDIPKRIAGRREQLSITEM